jgi:hypothetical protein
VLHRHTGAGPFRERRPVEQRDQLHEWPMRRRGRPRRGARQRQREPRRSENQETPAQAEKPTWTVEQRR